MNIRILVLLWLAALAGALLASGWWALAVFGFPWNELRQYMLSVAVPTYAASILSAYMLIMTFDYIIKEGGKHE